VHYRRAVVATIRRLILMPLLLSPVLVACGADNPATEASSAPSRTVEIVAAEYTFSGEPGVIVAGDTIEFVLDNVGQLDHSLEVLSAAGKFAGGDRARRARCEWFGHGHIRRRRRVPLDLRRRRPLQPWTGWDDHGHLTGTGVIGSK
jgi:hypothetical protein